MEEQVSHWSKATLAARVEHAGRELFVLRAPPELERRDFGLAQCTVQFRGKIEGVFWLRAQEQRTIGGYLSKNLDDMYIFAPRPVAVTADWQDLLAFVKQLLDFDYQFPADLQFEYRHADLTKKIEEARRRSGKPDK